MKIQEISKTQLFTEGKVEPNILLSVRNVMVNGKFTNYFEYMIFARLIQLLRTDRFYSEYSPFESSMSTSKELVDSLKSMSEEQTKEVATVLYNLLSAKNGTEIRNCYVEPSYWMNLFTSREATD